MDTILSFVLTLAWACLEQTPFTMKNVLFANFFQTFDVLQEVFLSSGLYFAPGLLDALQSSSPPLLGFFKNLPTTTRDLWGVYLLVLEKPGLRPRLYIGSGTSILSHGLACRMKQYEDGFLLPKFVSSSIDEGFEITYKGVLCWMEIPAPALVPVRRLLVFLLEATLAYAFWTMKAKKGDYGMGHLCKWDRGTLPYDGLCSHCALNEGIRGEFEMSAEDLETVAEEKKKKQKEIHDAGNSNWHFKQMEDNYHDYIGASTERVQKSRANNPGRDAKREANRVAKAKAEKKYHYERCNLSFSRQKVLEDHYKTPKHTRKQNEMINPFVCHPCNYGVANQSNLTRHYKTERHRENMERIRAEKAKAKEEAAGPSGQPSSSDD